MRLRTLALATIVATIAIASHANAAPAVFGVNNLWPFNDAPRLASEVALSQQLGVQSDRIIIEWRSLLRQISNAPSLAWPRWQALQAMAKGILHETESPTLTELPPLDYHQTRRIEHSLILRRH